jgi:hypothetical protein
LQAIGAIRGVSAVPAASIPRPFRVLQEDMTLPHDPPVYDPPPDPPIIVKNSYLLFGALGILHLVLAALFECLQMLNLVLGLLEILIAIWIAFAVSRWRKELAAWLVGERSRISPEPPTTTR